MSKMSNDKWLAMTSQLRPGEVAEKLIGPGLLSPTAGYPASCTTEQHRDKTSWRFNKFNLIQSDKVSYKYGSGRNTKKLYWHQIVFGSFCSSASHHLSETNRTVHESSADRASFSCLTYRETYLIHVIFMASSLGMTGMNPIWETLGNCKILQSLQLPLLDFREVLHLVVNPTMTGSMSLVVAHSTITPAGQYLDSAWVKKTFW